MRLFFCLVAVLCAISQSLPLAQSLPNSSADTTLPYGASSFILSNGLKCVLVYNAEPKGRAEIRLALNIGSLVEEEDQRGVAHLIEHLAFNGSKRFPAHEAVEFWEALGMSFGPHTNAYTSHDETVYRLHIPTDSLAHLSAAVALAADWLSGLDLDSTAIEKERGIILEEWRLSAKGAQGRISARFLAALFGNSRYAERFPIGTESSIRSLSHEALRRFYKDWYKPQNATLIIVGDFPMDSAKNIVRKEFDGSSVLLNPPEISPQEGVAQHGKKLELTNSSPDSLPQIHIVVDEELPNTLCATFWRVSQNPLISYEDLRLHSLRSIAISMTNARLQERAASDSRSAFRSAELSWLAYNRAFAGVVLTMEARESLFAGYEAVLAEIARLNREGFLPSEVERARKSLMQLALRQRKDSASKRSTDIADEFVAWALTGARVVNSQERFWLDSLVIANLTSESLQEILRSHIPAEANRMLIFIATPPQDSANITEANLRNLVQGAVERELPPYVEAQTSKKFLVAKPKRGKVVKERRWKESDITEWLCSNGVRVMLKPTSFNKKEVVVESFAEGGLSLASEKEYFEASMAASLQSPTTSGVGEVNGVELSRILSDKSVSVEPYIRRYYHGVRASCAPADIETMLQLFFAAQVNSRCDSAVAHSIKEGELQKRAVRGNFPYNALQDSIDAILYGNHFTARSPTPQELASWRHCDKGYRYFQSLFGNAYGATIIIVGDFDMRRIKPLVERYCASLPAKPPSRVLRDNGGYPLEGSREVVIHKGLDERAHIYQIYHDFLPARTLKQEITATIVEEIALVKLRNALRHEAGGVYEWNVKLSVDARPRPRYFASADFQCAPNRVEELTRAAHSTLALLRQIITDSDVEEAKQKILRQRELKLRDNSEWLQTIAFTLQNSDVPDVIAQYQQLLFSVSAADVRELSRLVFLSPNVYRFSLLPSKEDR
jgi:zinc protease